MLRIAITGGLASGKSLVAQAFRDLGCPVVDADALGHAALAEAAEEIRAAFGADVFTPSSTVDRRRLAALVFGGAEAESRRRTLNRILHPRIMAAAERQLNAWRREGHALAGVEAALLIEEGLLAGFERIVLVTAPREVRIARYVAGGGDRAQAEARMRAQWEDARKAPFATTVIDNSGSPELTRAQVAAAVAQWKREVHA